MGFWKRQFSSESTPSQNVFDAIFGILLPIICLIADPIVFRSSSFGPAIAKSYALYGYLEALIGIALLATFLFLRLSSIFLAGALMAGALFSFVLGSRLLPISLFGILLLIGILGFAPFLASFVFLRNAVRAWHTTGKPLPRAVAPAAAACVLVLLAPVVAQGWSKCPGQRLHQSDPISARYDLCRRNTQSSPADS